MDVTSYYADLTAHYGRYAGEAHGWHYGIWEADVRSHSAALVRSNEVLVRDLHIGPSTRILDVGCGGGGFAVWAARHFGAHVTGLTVVEQHLELARRLADQQGVSGRCEFLRHDMNAVQSELGAFDVVVNQETFCYATEKPKYLASVLALLRPGGWWRALEFGVQEQPLDARQQESYRAVCEGFYIPSLVPASVVRRMLAQAGFEIGEIRDVTAQVVKTATTIIRGGTFRHLLAVLHLDRLLYSRSERRRHNEQGHFLAGRRYSRGPQQGFFRHVYYSARKPLTDAPLSR